MHRRNLLFFLTIILLQCSGCKLLENAVSNVDGWDLSACISGFDTCWEFFTDNADKFEHGFVETMDSLTEGG